MQRPPHGIAAGSIYLKSTLSPQKQQDTHLVMQLRSLASIVFPISALKFGVISPLRRQTTHLVVQRPPHGVAAARDRHLHERVHSCLAHDIQPFRSLGRLGALPRRHLALHQALRQLAAQLSDQRRQQPGEDGLVEEALAVVQEAAVEGLDNL